MVGMATSNNKRRRIHVSKNKKKSWNKYCDVKDIDDFLEEQREDERTSGGLSNKPAENIFVIEVETEDDAVQPGTCKKKKDRSLRCFAALNPAAYSRVPVPVPENPGVIGKKQKARTGKILEKKLKNIQFLREPSQKRRKESLASRNFHDLWAKDEEVAEDATNKQQPKVPCHRYQKPSLLPSVELPHPGASYNPTYEDHQKLLWEAVVVEQKKEKEEQRLKRVLADVFPTKDKAPTYEAYLQEMSQGLFEEPEEEDEMDNQDEGLFEVGNPPVRAEDRKTKSQKRKKKIIAKQERERRLAKTEKNRLNDVFRLRSIKAAIKKQEEKSKEKQAAKDKREIEKMYKPHVLSSYKYEPQDLEVTLTEELPESLRSLKVEGSILHDRYKSLQRRNIIESRIKQRSKRKYKLKVQIKRSHRNFTLSELYLGKLRK